MSTAGRDRLASAILAGLAATGVGYAVAGRGTMGLAAVGGLAVGMAIVIRARTFLLIASITSLIFGSAAFPTLKSGAFFVRFVLLGALVAATLLERPERPVPWNRVDRLLAGLVAWAAISTLWSVAPGLSAARALGLGLIAAALLTAAHRVWLTEDRLLRDITTAASVIGAALVVGILLYVAGGDVALLSGRFRGIMENPNTVGLMAGLTLPLAVGLVISRVGVPRLWWITVAGVAAVTLLLSQSRGGFVSGAVGVLVVFVLSHRGRRTLVGAVVGCLIAVVLVLAVRGPTPAPSAVTSFAQRFQDRTGSGRLDAWKLSLELSAERPALGWGFGTTELVFGPPAAALPGWRGDLVPSAYLQALLELGPVGLTMLLVVVAHVLVRGWPGRRTSPLHAAVYGAVVAGTIHASVEAGMLAAGSVFALNYWLVALAAVRLRSLADAPAERMQLVAGR